MKNDNYYVIWGRMINELGLSGNELLVYAVIHGFSQIENQWFTGSLKYISEATCASKSTVIRSLNSLLDKGFIEKEETYCNDVKMCRYRVAKMEQVVSKWNGYCQNDTGGGVKMTLGYCQNDTGGGVKMTPNNNIYNTNDKIEDKKTGDTPEPPVFDLPAKAQKKKTKQQEFQEIVESYTQNQELKQAIWDFIEYRKKSKANFSTKALKLNLTKLDKLTSGDDNEKIAIINQTIECGWSGLFPLRQNKNCGNGKRPAHDIIREQEMEDIHKYLDLVD